MSHTDLPWHKNKNYADCIHAEHGDMVTDLSYVRVNSKEINEANAAFIVKACNNHYQILAALKSVRNCQTMHEMNWVEIDEAIKQAEAVK
ncbi:MAG: hypothetical protein ACUZ8H_02205 [Candidatus Anammoxibacter sp.]